ncbi:MAG: right-handed parallel beta-helix repeat-containing protein [Verrucomicrobiae bacterium]
MLGDDGNAGTSESAPLRTLARANKLNLHAGDAVLLAAGQQFGGQLAFERLTGTEAAPIVFSSYPPAVGGGDQRASIDAKGCQAGVCLKNCAHVAIRNLLITANAGGMKSDQPVRKDMRCGILIEADQPGKYEGFSVTNVAVRDVFFEEPGFVRAPREVRSANGTQQYGWGIRFLVTSADAVMRDVFIADCRIENIEHTGLKLTADSSNGLQRVEVQRVQIADTGGPGAQLSGVAGGHFSQLDVNRSGSADDTRKWGRGSGLWTWGSSDVVIEKSRFQNSSGPGDSAGVHIDYNCRNVIVQYNFSAHNAGGFCEILGNNHNCAYRYNISVNDGYRVKGQNGAFQEGKIFWLSGYVGDKSPRRGPFNTYFYNNTIYVGADIVAKVALADTAAGVLIANNIFCIEGRSQTVMGDQNRDDKGPAKGLRNAVFENNLYQSIASWPANAPVKDRSPIIGNPEFVNAGGMKLEDYIPQNARLVQNRGITIPRLRGDEVGLTVGLNPERDILGNKILGLPDLGAIELSENINASDK